MYNNGITERNRRNQKEMVEGQEAGWYYHDEVLGEGWKEFKEPVRWKDGKMKNIKEVLFDLKDEAQVNADWASEEFLAGWMSCIETIRKRMGIKDEKLNK